MELDQIRYFLSLANLLNFTRAAERCNISQPALTKAIQKLEFELGGQLIHRERHLTHLTELGNVILPALEKIWAAAENARTHAQEYNRREIALLNLGLAPSISARAFMDPLSQIAQSIPGLRVEIMEATGERLIEMLLQGTIGAALVDDLDKLPDRIERWRLFDERYVILLPLSHPLANSREFPRAALKESVWLEQTGGDLIQRLWHICFGPGEFPKIGHRARLDSHLQFMVEAGFGIMLVPEHAPRLAPLIALPLEGDPVRHEVQLLTVAGRRYTPALDALVKIARLRDWNSVRSFTAGNSALDLSGTKSNRDVQRSSSKGMPTLSMSQ